jgi:transmembrane 9 superfamily protein 3
MQFKAGDSVKLWVNKVGPYNNPQETYNYHSLPFCQLSENPGHKWGGLGEVLGGNELIDSQLDIKFLSMFMLFSYHPCLYLFPYRMSTVCIFSVYAFACLTNCINVVFTVENVEKGPICTLELDSKKIQQFSDAIESSYWFEFFIGLCTYM